MTNSLHRLTSTTFLVPKISYYSHLSVEDHGEGVMGVRMLISAAGEEVSRVTAVPPGLRNMGQRQQTSTAVLVTTDPNLLVHGSPAVASGMSYYLLWTRYSGSWGLWRRTRQWMFAVGVPILRTVDRCCGAR